MSNFHKLPVVILSQGRVLTKHPLVLMIWNNIDGSVKVFTVHFEPEWVFPVMSLFILGGCCVLLLLFMLVLRFL